MKRCHWVTNDLDYISYHDNEWGKPIRDDRKLFELLTLEGAQAGLSWITILKRREHYRKAFDNFDINKIQLYSEDKVVELLHNEGIIRNQLKIRSVINNAKKYSKIQEEFGSFSNYIWAFVDGKPIINEWKSGEEVPVNTELSIKISKDLKKRGFSFVGPTIIYSYLQAAGLVNDHLISCFCHPNNN